MNNRKDRFIILMSRIPDIQWNEIAERLEASGFFEAPASINHHGNYDGGLFDHSFEVTKQLLDLTNKLDLKWESPRSPYIVGMFHDVCKCDNYKKVQKPLGYTVFSFNGVPKPYKEEWEYNNECSMPGHGEKSVILTQNILGQLTTEEIMCIRWHMGAFDDKENWKYYSRAVKDFPNVLYTHTADMIASQIMGT